jgi:ATP-dependent Lhr-like helicase
LVASDAGSNYTDTTQRFTYAVAMAASLFHPSVERWFRSAFPGPTAVQTRAWEAIAAGRDTLISAPTGSGKTLAGFLAVIDGLVRQAQRGPLPDSTQILYVSPLKALSNDVQKNLQEPLEGIRRELAADLAQDAPIRAWVRTGDTPQSERARMRRTPPHILVTTPESLYILLTSESGRAMLSGVKTVIVDEIHAVFANKRGAHLALSLERLSALCERPPVRVGISATTRPLDLTARFLTGADGRQRATIIDVGHSRRRDLALEVPESQLEAVMSNEVWVEIYDRLAELIREHTTTLIFVNTRRLAERAARHLADRIGAEFVTSHHGSLAKEHRLQAEERLKAGRLKALVATASLELGIDIGDVDLVCQLGSPHAIATLIQRVGRSGHGIDALPKGRLFPLSRDDLVECTALLDAVERGELDTTQMCAASLDVLSQQIAAEVGMREWRAEELQSQFARAAPYADLQLDQFEAVLRMLAEGFSTARGRRSAHIHYDRVNGVLRARRGTTLTAVTNGGAIPDQFDYDVVLLPNEFPVGTLNEDFAFESLPGDIFQLGNTSYRIVCVRTGKVYVEDAAGQPPNIPFWFGEAPGRTDALSHAVSRLRADIDAALAVDSEAAVAADLRGRLGLPDAAAGQLVEYLAAARAALGGLPTHAHIFFERFFDETGDTHFVVHSPYGSRINRAWGLSLRKKFCRRFNFELQAAALEDTIVLSLGAVHSFALDEVTRYLSSTTVEHVLSQAVLAAPIFPTYWRWNSTIALAVRRFSNGRKSPPQFQRTDAEDLLSTVFPDQLACAENLGGGDREIPRHPLVDQTLHDCIRTTMDVDGLQTLLRRVEAGEVRITCRDLTTPSPLSQEVLTAKNFAFLDDAPAEERRTLAVHARRHMSVEEASEIGRLDADAIARVRQEAWPAVRNFDELHDALVVLGFITAREAQGEVQWLRFLEDLVAQRRVTRFCAPSDSSRTRVDVWVAAERLAELRLVVPQGEARHACAELPGLTESGTTASEAALRSLLRGRLDGLGPVTAAELGAPINVAPTALNMALAALENEGVAMRGHFSGIADEQWCERRLLARIHRYTLKRLRSEIEPVTLADFQRFLFRWQGLGSAQREGREAVAAVVSELQGAVLPAAAWERSVLPARIAAYGGDLLDSLSSAGTLVWWRPRIRGSTRGARQTVAASPIALVPRESLRHWQTLASEHADEEQERPERSAHAQRVLNQLTSVGALFFVELVQSTGLLRTQVEDALGELVARGLVTADSFNGLRALLTPQRRRARYGGRRAAAMSEFDAAGRWACVSQSALENNVGRDEAIEFAAMSLLRRYGVITRAVAIREPLAPPWRELAAFYRRAEARGEIRGGRFVEPFGGEQFALAEAVATLRRVRRDATEEWIVCSASDPAQLAGLAGLAGQTTRVPQIAANRIAFRNGVPVAAVTSIGFSLLGNFTSADEARARSALHPQQAQPRSATIVSLRSSSRRN